MDKNIRVHRLVADITQAVTGADAQLDAVCRAVSKHFAEGLTAYAGGGGGIVRDDPASISAAVAPEFPNPTISNNAVWVWIINEITGQRQLVCYESEVVLTQQKTAAGNVPINPPIGVRVEKLMTILPAYHG